jgi:hypothetical protein
MEAPVPKFKADVNVAGDGANSRAATPVDHAKPQEPAATAVVEEPDVVTTVVTIGVIGVAAALFDVALIPGIVIGVAAAYGPKYLANIGDRLQPMFSYALRSAYTVTRSARDAVAQAQERIHDIAAEVEAEEAAGKATGAAASPAAS